MARRAARRHRLDSGIEAELACRACKRATSRANGARPHGPGRDRARKQGHQVFPDLLRRPVRHACGRRSFRHARSTRCAKSGAGFAGFAAWFDMTPADPDMLAMPDADSLIQLPWKPEVGVGRRRSRDGRQAEVAQNPRQVLKRVVAAAAEAGLRAEDRRRMRVLPDRAGRTRDLRRGRPAVEALLRPAGADAPLRRGRRDLRRDGRARLEAVPERPRGRERPVRDELGVRHGAAHRRPARLLQVHGEVDRREARAARDLHAEAVRQSDRQRLPRARLALVDEGRQQRVRGSARRARRVRRPPITSSAASCTTPRRCARSPTRW